MINKTKQGPIPVTVIGGFLGSGKTTLLNHVLSENHGIKAAVLVNDFGSINIDAKLVVGVEGETVNFANGCICCTIRDDLVGACLDLLKREELPELVLIELSGVSDPMPVLNTFLETELGKYFSLNSMLSVVDAEQLPHLTGDMAELARLQIRAADIIALNKIDLVSANELTSVKQLINSIDTGKRILDVQQGQVPLALIFDGVAQAFTHNISLCDDEHQSSASNTFATWQWTNNQPLSLPKLRSTLAALPESIYRCKGFVYIEELPGLRFILQMVGKRYSIQQEHPWQEGPKSEIVIIGEHKGVDAQALQTAFDACVGTSDDSDSATLRLMRKLAPELLRKL